MQVKIYHNPKCSKSRQTLEIIQENGFEPIILEYLQSPPNHQELDSILQGLGMDPRDLMRKGESEYTEYNLADELLSRDELIDAIVKYPKLLERPVVLVGNQVVIGRPPESVLTILP